jgi:hypothetical protein
VVGAGRQREATGRRAGETAHALFSPQRRKAAHVLRSPRPSPQRPPASYIPRMTATNVRRRHHARHAHEEDIEIEQIVRAILLAGTSRPAVSSNNDRANRMNPCNAVALPGSRCAGGGTQRTLPVAAKYRKLKNRERSGGNAR